MILSNRDTGNDSHTKLLIQSNTVNGSTTFTDLSGVGNIITGYGGVAHSTSQFKYGKSAIYFDGLDDYLSIPDSDNWYFGSGDFMIDFWANFVSETDYVGFFKHISGTNLGHTLFYSGSESQFIYLVGDGTTINPNSIPFDATINKWYHIALVRNSGAINFYVDGQLLKSMNQNLVDASGNLIFGDSTFHNSNLWQNNHLYFKGFPDQIRISKGIARWTRNFTPPNRHY